MTELLDRVLSATTLREAIRAKLRAGVQSDTISWLIACYVPTHLMAGGDRGRHRLPVEMIPPHKRPAFLQSLERTVEHR